MCRKQVMLIAVVLVFLVCQTPQALQHIYLIYIGRRVTLKVCKIVTTRYLRICASSRSRCAVGLSVVGATVDGSRCAIIRHNLGRRY